jgi:hypothetical protein
MLVLLIFICISKMLSKLIFIMYECWFNYIYIIIIYAYEFYIFIDYYIYREKYINIYIFMLAFLSIGWIFVVYWLLLFVKYYNILCIYRD